MLCTLLVGQKERRKSSCEFDFPAQADSRKITHSPHPNNLPFHQHRVNRKVAVGFQTLQGLADVSMQSLLKPSLLSHIVLSTWIAEGSDWLRLSPHLFCI